MKTNNQRIVWNVPQIRWLFLLLGVFESGLERLLIFPSALLFVLLHFLFCAEDAVYIGTHGLEFFVIILEIMVSIVLGVLLNRKLLFFCSKVFHSRKLSIRRVLGCSSHHIRESKLEEVVLAALQEKIQQISGLEERLDEINEIPQNQRRLKSVEEHMKVLEQEEQKSV